MLVTLCEELVICFSVIKIKNYTLFSSLIAKEWRTNQTSTRNWRSCIYHTHCEMTESVHLLAFSVLTIALSVFESQQLGKWGQPRSQLQTKPIALAFALLSPAAMLCNCQTVIKWMSDMNYRVRIGEDRKTAKAIQASPDRTLPLIGTESCGFFIQLSRELPEISYLLTDEHENWKGQLKRRISWIPPTLSWFFSNFYTEFFIFLFKSLV